MAVTDNYQNNRGPGMWLFFTYNPLRAVGPIKGNLLVAKDFYHVTVNNDKGDTRTVANFPSQNVAYVINENFLKDMELKAFLDGGIHSIPGRNPDVV